MSEQKTEKYKLVAFDFFEDVVHEHTELVATDVCVRPQVGTFNILQQIFVIEQNLYQKAKQRLIDQGHIEASHHTFNIGWIYSMDLVKFNYLNQYKEQYPVQRDFFHTHDIVCAFGIDCDEADTYLVVRYTD